MIFQISVFLYWILTTTIYFNIPELDTLYEYSLEAAIGILCVCIASSSNSTTYQRSMRLLLTLHFIYACTATALFGDAPQFVLMLESMALTSLMYFIIKRPEFSTGTINRNNIQLAFYKGRKGSLLMNIAELFGLPVKCMYILSGSSILRPEKGVSHFVFEESSSKANSIRNSANYYIHDTGIKHTKSFSDKMRAQHGKEVRKLFFRVRCIEGIKDILYDIKEEYEPNSIFHNIPSMYLKHVLGIRRKN